MNIGEAIALGAAGGGVAEVVNRWVDLVAWQKARHTARMRQRDLPALTKYIDPLADSLVALTRLAMGAGAGWLFHGQVTGISAAIAVGAAAPALLAQVGAARGGRGELKSLELVLDDSFAAGNGSGLRLGGDSGAQSLPRKTL